jgi:signal recognition particle receptor subunit beta
MDVDTTLPATHVVKLLVTGPMGAGSTELIAANSQSPVVAQDGAGGIDLGVFRIDDADGSVELLLFGTPGEPEMSFVTDMLKDDVDAVIYVVDGTDESSRVTAAEGLRAVYHGLRAPLVIAVNECVEITRAHRVAAALDAPPAAFVTPCRIADPQSARDVVAGALDAAATRLERVVSTGWQPPADRDPEAA